MNYQELYEADARTGKRCSHCWASEKHRVAWTPDRYNAVRTRWEANAESAHYDAVDGVGDVSEEQGWLESASMLPLPDGVEHCAICGTRWTR